MDKSIQRMFEPRRELGRTGFRATQLGIGDVADRAVEFEQCVATVRRAMDAGLNIVDTAPGYEKGYSEEIVGAAVRGRREGLFVINKIDFLDQPVAPQVESSLKRMGLPEVDLFVFHALSDLALWRKLASPGGAMEELAGCVRAGGCRFRGISSHHPDVLREAIMSGLCDVVMYPIGAYVDARYVSEILPLAKKHGVGTVCFKTFGAGRLLGGAAESNRTVHLRPRGKVSSGGVAVMEEEQPSTARLTIRECIHYTLTCDPDVALLGMSFPNEQDAAFEAAKSFRPLDAVAMEELRAKARRVMNNEYVGWNPN
ncbi:MAG: aldo/keto reductase [Planctomycetes bacterium]|nr:aldo/keto reductase [Planctomycetota bacterium]